MTELVRAWAVYFGAWGESLHDTEAEAIGYVAEQYPATKSDATIVHLREVVTCSECAHYARDTDCPTGQQWCDAYNVAVYPMMSCPDWTGADGERA